MIAPPIQALIAEDEPVLARGMVRTLSRLWPALQMCALVHDGEAAIDAARIHRPDILFLDIHMPGCDGLQAATRIIDDWAVDQPLPLIVFVTAFDRHAIAAFERAAADYVLKPVQPERLEQTCERLKQRLQERQGTLDDGVLAPVHALLASQRSEPALTMIQAGVGSTLHMIPVADVMFFQADGKYVRVVTPVAEHLIRTPLCDILPRMDRADFMQIHRGTAVRTCLIDKVVREDTGRIYLHLKDWPERLTVSRTYAHLFKPM
jgi:DNA-binding LytR/AlgR family response regulator